MPRACSCFVITAISGSGRHDSDVLQAVGPHGTCNPSHKTRATKDDRRREKWA